MRFNREPRRGGTNITRVLSNEQDVKVSDTTKDAVMSIAGTQNTKQRTQNIKQTATKQKLLYEK